MGRVAIIILGGSRIDKGKLEFHLIKAVNTLQIQKCVSPCPREELSVLEVTYLCQR